MPKSKQCLLCVALFRRLLGGRCPDCRSHLHRHGPERHGRGHGRRPGPRRRCGRVPPGLHLGPEGGERRSRAQHPSSCLVGMLPMLHLEPRAPKEPAVMLVWPRDVVPPVRAAGRVDLKTLLLPLCHRPVLLDHDHTILRQRCRSVAQRGYDVRVDEVLQTPLQPDQIVAAGRRCVLLEPALHEDAALRALVTQVAPSLLQPTLARLDECHGSDALPHQHCLSHAANAGAAVHDAAQTQPRETREHAVEQTL
mmetsp:Transcript_86903/g.280737  ORF Transcript_86903/g.280737 Transcript_86903/m.280737 type:complete len:252 (-) Transcript_86903:574-1329(-)